MRAFSKVGYYVKSLITLKPNLEYNYFNYASATSVAVIFLIESDTLGNVQKKFSNTISPHCFGTWCSIQIITKATHICNCVIHQYNFNCIWVEKHNKWYHTTVKSSGSISICWRKYISVLIIISYIRSECVFLRSVKKIKGNQLCIFVFECMINEWMVLFLKIWKY